MRHRFVEGFVEDHEPETIREKQEERERERERSQGKILQRSTEQSILFPRSGNQ
jgi:hypothetical protein